MTLAPSSKSAQPTAKRRQATSCCPVIRNPVHQISAAGFSWPGKLEDKLVICDGRNSGPKSLSTMTSWTTDGSQIPDFDFDGLRHLIPRAIPHSRQCLRRLAPICHQPLDSRMAPQWHAQTRSSCPAPLPARRQSTTARLGLALISSNSRSGPIPMQCNIQIYVSHLTSNPTKQPASRSSRVKWTISSAPDRPMQSYFNLMSPSAPMSAAQSIFNRLASRRALFEGAFS